MSQQLGPKNMNLKSSMKTCKTSRTNTPKDTLFIVGNWNAKVGSQEIPGVTGKFVHGVQNEAGQKLHLGLRSQMGLRKHYYEQS